MKRLYRALGLIAGVIITVLFVWYVVRSLRGQDLSAYATPRAVIGIVLAALCWTASLPLLTLAWHGMLFGLGIRNSRRELLGIIGVSQFAKYVPGNVAQYVGRIGMSLARGMPPRPLAVTIILETLLLIAAALAVGVGAGALSDVGLRMVRHHGAQLALVAGLVALAICGLFGFRQFAPRLLRRLSPRYASTLDGELMPPQTTLIRAFVIYCAVYGAAGSGLILLAHFLLPGAAHDHWLLIASVALAWVVGFVTPGAPAGLGVREGLLLLMLTPVYSVASASVLVIALRIATTLGDLFSLALGGLLLPKRRNNPTTASSPP